MIQMASVTDMKVRFDRARFFIPRAINQQLYTRLDQGSGAHGAGFDCRVDRRVRQAIVAAVLGGFPQGHHFRMPGRATLAPAAFSSTTHQSPTLPTTPTTPN